MSGGANCTRLNASFSTPVQSRGLWKSRSSVRTRGDCVHVTRGGMGVFPFFFVTTGAASLSVAAAVGSAAAAAVASFSSSSDSSSRTGRTPLCSCGVGCMWYRTELDWIVDICIYQVSASV